MKQSITPDQLQELSDEKKEILFKWEKDRGYHVKGDFTIEEGRIARKEFLATLTIGEMIEFLIENGNPLRDTYIDDSYTFVFSSGSEKERIDIGWTNHCGNSAELCDALWEEVKEVLQDEKKT